MSLRSWWNNENYDREYMRRFREATPELDDLPDHVVAKLSVFQWFSVREAGRELWRELTRPFDRFGPDEETPNG